MCSLPIPCMISCSSCPLRSECEKSTIFKLDLEWMDREKEKWVISDSSLGGQIICQVMKSSDKSKKN